MIANMAKGGIIFIDSLFIFVIFHKYINLDFLYTSLFFDKIVVIWNLNL